MSFNLTDNDTKLCQLVSIFIDDAGGPPIDGFPDDTSGFSRQERDYEFDNGEGYNRLGYNNKGNAADKGRVSGSRRSLDTIGFQFPPIIKSETKGLRWQHEFTTYIYEPQYHFKGGDPKKISITMTYVVGGPQIWKGTKGAPATINNIVNEVKRVKAYFYMGGADAAVGRIPNFKIKMYQHMYDGYASFRGMSYSATFSDSLIRTGDLIYPIKTEITLSLEMATQCYDIPEDPDGNLATLTGNTDPQKAALSSGAGLVHPNIAEYPKKTWY